MNKDEEQEYRIWSSEKRPVSKSSDNRQDLGEKKGIPPKRHLPKKQNELNDIPFVVKHPEVLGPVALIFLFGGIFMLVSVPYGEAGTFIALGGSYLFLFLFLGYYLVVKPSEEYEEKQKLDAEAIRKRKNEENRKWNLNEKNKDLGNAKNLVDEGGIDNLKKAIGIFEKYAKY